MMKPRALTLILATHALFGAACYWLGSEKSPFSSGPLSQAVPSSIIHSTTSQPTQGTSPTDSPSSLNEAMASHGFRARVESAIAPIGSMEKTEVIEALRDVRYQPGNSDTLIKQQMLLARFTELDPENAIRYVTTLQGFDHELGLITVLDTWTAIDPMAASKYFEKNYETLSIEEDADPSIAAGALAAEWTRQDPDAALKWVDSLPGELRAEAKGRVVSQLTMEDPASATAVVEEMAPGLERTEMLETLVDQWAYQDPQAAGDYVVDETVGLEQRQAMVVFIKAWMGEAPMDASTWLGNLSAGTAKDAAIIGMTQTDLLTRDPEANAVWSSSIQDPTLRDRAIQIAVARWSTTDPNAAQTWLQSHSGN